MFDLIFGIQDLKLAAGCWLLASGSFYKKQKPSPSYEAARSQRPKAKGRKAAAKVRLFSAKTVIMTIYFTLFIISIQILRSARLVDETFLWQEQVEDDAHLGVDIASVQWIKTANNITSGNIDIAGLNHSGEARAEVGIAVRHHRVGGTDVEVVPERAAVG